MKTKIERLEKAVEIALDSFTNMKQFSFRADSENAASAIRAIQQVLASPPEMETVEVTVWAIVAPSGFVETTSGNEDLQRSQVGNDNSPFFKYQVVSLTGSYQRPKKQPVEKIWTLHNASLVEDRSGSCRWVRVAPFPDDIPIGKTGTLVYTYTE